MMPQPLGQSCALCAMSGQAYLPEYYIQNLQYIFGVIYKGVNCSAARLPVRAD